MKKKQKIQMLLVILILLALLGAYFGMKYYNKNQLEEDETKSYSVTNLNIDDIVEINIENENGSLHFKKDGDNWINADSPDEKTDQTKIKNLASYISNVEGEECIEEVKDMSLYGLNVPKINVTAKTSDKTIVLHIGDENSVINKYYVCLDGEKKVYTVGISLYSEFNIKTEDTVLEETSESENK